MKCPNCGKSELKLVVIPSYATRIQGVPVQIDNAELRNCQQCGEEVVSAKELKRWRDTQRQQMSASGWIPKPAEIRSVRKRIQLSQKDFAALLGVTRQTVSAWERENGVALQFGPTSLLLGMMKVHLDGQAVTVLSYLFSAANARGQIISRKESEAALTRNVPRQFQKPPRPAGAHSFVPSKEKAA